MGLHDSCLSIHVDNQTGKIVTLAMNQSVGVIICIIGYTNSLTHGQSRQKTGMPEFIVNLHIRKRKDTNGNRPLLVMADSDEIACIGYHTNDFTFLNILVHPLDGTREHPGMKAS
jgi:hypothetical protein